VGAHASGEELIQRLRDPDAVVRRQAARSLGLAKSKESVKELCLVLLEDASAPVRRAAAEALGRIGDRSAKNALERAMRHDDEESVRKAAQGAHARLSLPSGEMPGILPTSKE
jgi:HEAT repeat protein